MDKKTHRQKQAHSLRDNINQITEQLITELHEAELTASEKIAFLKTLLPYSVGKLPTASVNVQIGRNGQPTSARVVELTENGGVSTDKVSTSGGFRLSDIAPINNL